MKKKTIAALLALLTSASLFGCGDPFAEAMLKDVPAYEFSSSEAETTKLTEAENSADSAESESAAEESESASAENSGSEETADTTDDSESAAPSEEPEAPAQDPDENTSAESETAGAEEEKASEENTESEETAGSGSVWDVSAVETEAPVLSKASNLLEDDPTYTDPAEGTEDADTEDASEQTVSKALSLIGNSILEEAESDDLVNAQPAATKTPVPTRAVTPTPSVNYGSVSNTSGQNTYSQNANSQNYTGKSGTEEDIETLASKGTGVSYDYYGRPAVFTADETDIGTPLLTAAAALAAMFITLLLRRKQKES